jgi:hypothetical protein
LGRFLNLYQVIDVNLFTADAESRAGVVVTVFVIAIWHHHPLLSHSACLTAATSTVLVAAIAEVAAVAAGSGHWFHRWEFSSWTLCEFKGATPACFRGAIPSSATATAAAASAAAPDQNLASGCAATTATTATAAITLKLGPFLALKRIQGLVFPHGKAPAKEASKASLSALLKTQTTRVGRGGGGH